MMGCMPSSAFTFNSINLLFLFQFFEVLMVGLQFLFSLNHLEKKINSLQRSKKYYYPCQSVRALAWFENVGGISLFFSLSGNGLCPDLLQYFSYLYLLHLQSLSLSLSHTHNISLLFHLSLEMTLSRSLAIFFPIFISCICNLSLSLTHTQYLFASRSIPLWLFILNHCTPYCLLIMWKVK